MSSDRDVLKLVDEFAAKEVSPRAAQMDSEDRLASELIETASKIGLLSLHLDGDGEVDLRQMPLIHETTERIAAESPAIAAVISGFRHLSLLLKRHGSSIVVDRWYDSTLRGKTFGSFCLTEPQAGTDLRGIKTVATRAEGGWKLSGHKMWIGNAGVASFAIVLCKNGSEARDAKMLALVVDTSSKGVVGKRGPAMSGFRGMPNGTYDFDNVFVPDDYVLNVDGFRGMINGVNMARVEAASYACGILRASLQASVDRACSREAFGSIIGDLPSIQSKIGRIAADYHAARELTLRAAESFAAHPGGEPDIISMAKMFASDAARRGSDAAMQIHAASGIPFSEPVGRMNRDAKITQIFDGTSEVHETMLGRHAVSQGLASGLNTPFLPR